MSCSTTPQSPGEERTQVLYKVAYLTPEIHASLQALATRDKRSASDIVAQALSYYRHLHKDPRDPPAQPARRRGRPPKPKD